jgi:hypothetical protein
MIIAERSEADSGIKIQKLWSAHNTSIYHNLQAESNDSVVDEHHLSLRATTFDEDNSDAGVFFKL